MTSFRYMTDLACSVVCIVTTSDHTSGRVEDSTVGLQCALVRRSEIMDASMQRWMNALGMWQSRRHHLSARSVIVVLVCRSLCVHIL